MKLSPMQYKSFIWPHNPHTLEVGYSSELKALFLPYGGSTAQNFGQRARTVTCQGEFYGNTAFSNYIRLAALFQEKQTGLLVLPGMESFFAHFSSLEVVGKPGPSVVAYTCSFLEEPTHVAHTALSATYCVAAQGETLWDIASRYGVPLQALLTLNPAIRDPFSVQAGKVIWLQ